MGRKTEQPRDYLKPMELILPLLLVATKCLFNQVQRTPTWPEVFTNTPNTVFCGMYQLNTSMYEGQTAYIPTTNRTLPKVMTMYLNVHQLTLTPKVDLCQLSGNKAAHLYCGNIESNTNCSVYKSYIGDQLLALQCDRQRDAWIHATCVNVNEHELETFETLDIPFICPECEWTRDDYQDLPSFNYSINSNISQGDSEVHDINVHLEPLDQRRLSFAHLNINELTDAGHMDELRVFMTEKPYDVIGITESKLIDKTPQKDYELDGYECLVNHRSHKEGVGVLLYVRSSLNMSE